MKKSLLLCVLLSILFIACEKDGQRTSLSENSGRSYSGEIKQLKRIKFSEYDVVEDAMEFVWNGDRLQQMLLNMNGNIETVNVVYNGGKIDRLVKSNGVTLVKYTYDNNGRLIMVYVVFDHFWSKYEVLYHDGIATNIELDESDGDHLDWTIFWNGANVEKEEYLLEGDDDTAFVNYVYDVYPSAYISLPKPILYFLALYEGTYDEYNLSFSLLSENNCIRQSMGEYGNGEMVVERHCVYRGNYPVRLRICTENDEDVIYFEYTDGTKYDI